METLLGAIDFVLVYVRPALLGLAIGLGGVAALDWAVRTRRINPFGRVARLLRTTVDPLLMPVERIVVRAGGLPTAAPWYALMGVVLGGILLITALTFAREQIALVAMALNSGARGVYRLTMSWVFTVLQMAIAVRVVMSWVRLRPSAWYSRWAYRLSEPILRPIRNIIPLIGMVDISPMVAWFALGLVETLLLNAW